MAETRVTGAGVLAMTIRRINGKMSRRLYGLVVGQV